MSTLKNPFGLWAELARGLDARVLQEMEGVERTPFSEELIGSMAGLITACEHLKDCLVRLEKNDAPAYAAFLRALEKS